MSPAHLPHILLTHQNFVSRLQSGNGRAVPQIDEYLRRGWKVTVVTTHRGYLDGEENSPGARSLAVEREGNLEIHRLPLGAATGPKNRGKSYLQFCRAALAYGKELPAPSLVFATSPPLPQAMVSLRLALHFRCPMVFEARDLWPALLVELGLVRNVFSVLALEFMEALAYACAAEVVSVTPGIRPYLRGFGIPAEKIAIIPSGAVPLSADDPAALRKAWRQQQNLGDDEIAIWYGGSFNEHYGIEFLLEAAERLARENARIKWYFAGGGRTAAAVEAKARACGSIRYLGNLARQEIAPALCGADLGLNSFAKSPLFDLAIPGKLFEAMAAGLPIISLVAGHSADLVLTANCGSIVEPGHLGSFVAEVKRLAVLSEADRRRLGENGRAWILKHFHTAEMVADLGDVVARALRAPPVTWRSVARGVGRAVAATASRRSPRLVRSLYRENRAALITECFHDWLQQRPAARKELLAP